jgi:hypothetical protein
MSITSTGSSSALRLSLGAEDQRHAHLLVEQRRAVVDAAVLAELLAVIAPRWPHHLALEAPVELRRRGRSARGRRADLAVVAIHVARAEGGLLIGLVDVEVVHPEKLGGSPCSLMRSTSAARDRSGPRLAVGVVEQREAERAVAVLGSLWPSVWKMPSVKNAAVW